MNFNEALRQKLPPDEYALLFEVRDAAGFAAKRSADAIAIGLWPSRGCPVIGIEIKASRSDWLRELKDPEKAEQIARFCDHWVVAAPAGLVKAEEVPLGWGLWELGDAGRWKTTVSPSKLAPIPLTRTFVVAMLKRASQSIEDRVKAAVDKERANERTEIDRRVEEDIKRHRVLSDERFRELQSRVSQFEKAAGISIDNWDAPEIGRAVKIVRETDEAMIIRNARTLRDKLDAFLAP